MKPTNPLILLPILPLALSLPEPNTRLANRLAARAAARENRQGQPLIPVSAPFPVDTANGTMQEQYSSNWAGGVHTSPPAGSKFTAITASFNIPKPSVPAGGSGTYAASAWAGIDGDTYGNAILQSGCDFTAHSSGGPSYDCWYEWFPNPLTDFGGFTPAAGDTITVSIKSTSPSAGTATLTNSRTGQSVSKSLTAPSAQNTLAGQNAEWIVEDFESGGSLVPFANFGQVTFTGCSATAGSSSVGTSGATMIDIEQNGQILTKTTFPSGSSVQVTYQ